MVSVFYALHTSSEMLSFLHHWDYCWKGANQMESYGEWRVTVYDVIYGGQGFLIVTPAPRFYGQLKIHKPGVPIRPIVS